MERNIHVLKVSQCLIEPKLHFTEIKFNPKSLVGGFGPVGSFEQKTYEIKEIFEIDPKTKQRKIINFIGGDEITEKIIYTFEKTIEAYKINIESERKRREKAENDLKEFKNMGFWKKIKYLLDIN